MIDKEIILVIAKIRQELYKDKEYRELLLNGKFDMKFMDYVIGKSIQQGRELEITNHPNGMKNCSCVDTAQKLAFSQGIAQGRRQIIEEVERIFVIPILKSNISTFFKEELRLWDELKQKLQKEIK